MLRYPENTIIEIDDFRQSDWKVTIDSSDRDGYASMWQSLSAAAKTAIENGRVSQGKALWLLADACSMVLTPTSANQPFKPCWVMDGKRSSLPEDFEKSDVALFAQFSAEIDDVWLQARVADLVWLLLSPRSPKYALIAIDAYRRVPLDNENWMRGGRDCWARALGLTRMLKTGAGERIKEIEASLVSALIASTTNDAMLAHGLADLLAENGLGQGKSGVIAEKLEVLAGEFELNGDLQWARDFFDASAKWFKRAGNNAKAADMTVCVAEGWVKEAVARISSDHPSYTIASGFYENAIQTYRTIPHRERATHRADERMSELNKYLSEAGARSLDEMGVITSPAIDITEIVEASRKSVSGNTAANALAAFTNLHGGARVAELRQLSEQMLRDHPLQSLFTATHMSKDGRVVAKRPGMGFGDTNSDEYKATVWAEMVKHYGMELGMVVQSSIWPALEVFVFEHRLRESDFVMIASHSPIVPKGRAHLFGKALFAGFEKDFVVALHLLIPQIEHMVRWHLKGSAIKTTNLDKDGIENENGLSTLVDMPEVAQIFGEDLAFELKALFCDAFGANLRNELAHGLLDNDECQSLYSIYAWWLALRLVLKAFWNARRKLDTEQKVSDLRQSPSPTTDEA